MTLSQSAQQEHPPPLPQERFSPVRPTPTPHSLPSAEEIATLLEETLPQFDLDPERMPARFHRQVCERIYAYAVLYRKDVQAMLRRADTHLPMIKRLLHEHELPTYFAYIPLVESAFDEDASHPKSGARGLWQLMARTARGYGLKVSKRLDERLHPQRATLAAVRYLQTLQNRFGEAAPLHVLAAYNFGENNLAKALRQAQTRDIWPLFVHRRLPYQTREYLIKIVTLWVIVAHPERFQFILDTPATSPTYAQATIPPPAIAAEPVQRPGGPQESSGLPDPVGNVDIHSARLAQVTAGGADPFPAMGETPTITNHMLGTAFYGNAFMVNGTGLEAMPAGLPFCSPVVQVAESHTALTVGMPGRELVCGTIVR